MLFITTMKSRYGQHLEAIKLYKRPKVPEGIVIKHFIGIFGTLDALVIFEAPDEATAAEFTVQFCHVADVQTSLALPIEELKWTR
jgi:uncharacterized protein with GYD domain